VYRYRIAPVMESKRFARACAHETVPCALMGLWVLLRHDLPDGSWHHDWMMERDVSEADFLLTFRLNPEVVWPPSSGFSATRIGDHRREYLTYEGPVSRGRGHVRRVSRGRCELRFEGKELVVGFDGRWFRGISEGSHSRAGEQPWVFQQITVNLED